MLASFVSPGTVVPLEPLTFLEAHRGVQASEDWGAGNTNALIPFLAARLPPCVRVHMYVLCVWTW